MKLLPTTKVLFRDFVLQVQSEHSAFGIADPPFKEATQNDEISQGFNLRCPIKLTEP